MVNIVTNIHLQHNRCEVVRPHYRCAGRGHHTATVHSRHSDLQEQPGRQQGARTREKNCKLSTCSQTSCYLTLNFCLQKYIDKTLDMISGAVTNLGKHVMPNDVMVYEVMQTSTFCWTKSHFKYSNRWIVDALIQKMMCSF